MDHIEISATDRSPRVSFDFASGVLLLQGEAYPEDAAAFFGPLQQALQAFLAAPGGPPLRFDVALSYFNSSSAKALMNLFMLLEAAAAQGRDVLVRWHFLEGDDTLEEAGDDFSADFLHARFEKVMKGES